LFFPIFKIIIRTSIPPDIGAIIANIILNNKPGLSLNSLPGEVGKGFRMLGGA